MAIKYHISQDGVARPCKAQSQDRCTAVGPSGDAAPHAEFNSQADAQSFAEAINEKAADGYLSGSSKGDSQSKVKAAPVAAEASYTEEQGAVLYDFATGNFNEISSFEKVSQLSNEKWNELASGLEEEHAKAEENLDKFKKNYLNYDSKEMSAIEDLRRKGSLQAMADSVSRSRSSLIEQQGNAMGSPETMKRLNESIESLDNRLKVAKRLSAELGENFLASDTFTKKLEHRTMLAKHAEQIEGRKNFAKAAAELTDPNREAYGVKIPVGYAAHPAVYSTDGTLLGINRYVPGHPKRFTHKGKEIIANESQVKDPATAIKRNEAKGFRVGEVLAPSGIHPRVLKNGHYFTNERQTAKSKAKNIPLPDSVRTVDKLNK